MEPRKRQVQLILFIGQTRQGEDLELVQFADGGLAIRRNGELSARLQWPESALNAALRSFREMCRYETDGTHA